ncbi:MAG: N-acetylmuramoyl-L-alanine amidase [bacterium]
MEINNLIDVLPWHEDPERRWSKRDTSQIKKVVLHQELANGTIENVNQYHIIPGSYNHLSPRGAPHFAYHFGIRKNGEVAQCNHYQDITWHAKGQNAVSVGVMLVGDFKGTNHPGAEPTPQQIDSLSQLVSHLKNEFNLDNQAIYGHYHFGKPACPGDTVKAWIQKLRGEDKVYISSMSDVQSALNKLGYWCGEVDGIFGPNTERAVRDFQADHGLVVDGIPGPKTKSKLQKRLMEI